LFPIVFLTFILVPLAEIAVFIKVGGFIGVWPTVGLVIAISVFGTWLLKRQGLQTFGKAQAAFSRGEMPVREMLDGFFLVLAALLMVTPGLLTDLLGFLLLVPAVRHGLGPLAARWVMARTTTTIFESGGRRSEWGDEGARPGNRGPIIEGEASVVDETEPRGSDDKRLPKDR
jgi:UPF0716 protein FxsA